jgi:hypothetical protein
MSLENVFIEVEQESKGGVDPHATISHETPRPIFTLTRYLYIKEDVLTSLFFAILDKDYKQAVFWTCELYYSGYQEETSEYLMAIYRELFRSRNPRMAKFLETMAAKWADGAEYVATIARNLAAPCRKYDVSAFIAHDINPPVDETICDPIFYVTLKAVNVEPYATIESSDTLPARFVLQKVMPYSTKKNAMRLFSCIHLPETDGAWRRLLEEHRDNWLYYASFAPIWQERIQIFGGIIDHEKKTVFFSEEDMDEDGDTPYEQFYLRYGYELDEQTSKIQSARIHIQPTVQLTKPMFCSQYGGVMKTIKIKRRVT